MKRVFALAPASLLLATFAFAQPKKGAPAPSSASSASSATSAASTSNAPASSGAACVEPERGEHNRAAIDERAHAIERARNRGS